MQNHEMLSALTSPVWYPYNTRMVRTYKWLYAYFVASAGALAVWHRLPTGVVHHRYEDASYFTQLKIVKFRMGVICGHAWPDL